LGKPQRGAQGIDFARFERAQDQDKIYVGSCAQLAFSGAAVKNDGEQVPAKRFAGGLQKVIEHLLDLGWELRSFQWPGDGHEGSGLLRFGNRATQFP
jgi:hypothetical protein